MTHDIELIMEIERIVWDPMTSDIEKTHAVQGLLYQYDAIKDAESIRREQYHSFRVAVENDLGFLDMRESK